MECQKVETTLSGLLDRRNALQLALGEAQNDLDAFLAAAAIRAKEAVPRAVGDTWHRPADLPPRVRNYLRTWDQV